jgi:hypothetical protein
MKLENFFSKKEKRPVRLDLENYNRLIKDLTDFPNSMRYFEALHEEAMGLLSTYGKPCGFLFRDKCFDFEEKNISENIIFEFRAEHRKKFLSDILLIYIRGKFSEFNGMVGLYREPGKTSFLDPSKMVILDLEGKTICEYEHPF